MLRRYWGRVFVNSQNWVREGFKKIWVQSGASSLAKRGGAYFSVVYGSIEDPLVVPGLYDIPVP